MYYIVLGYSNQLIDIQPYYVSRYVLGTERIVNSNQQEYKKCPTDRDIRHLVEVIDIVGMIECPDTPGECCFRLSAWTYSEGYSTGIMIS